MSSNTAQILNPSVLLKPSEKLRKYISKVKVTEDLPAGICKFVFKNKIGNKVDSKPRDIKYLITEEDRDYIGSIDLSSCKESNSKCNSKITPSNDVEHFLSLKDLHWLYEYLQKENKDNDKVYLFELIEGSEVILPENQVVPRNEELEKRCIKLKAAQQNRDYHQMTKNVENSKKRLPEDTIAYQLKQMNRHLVAIFQFVVSVAAGFTFGFIGVELIVGNLDFGFRLLLGIICALTIAVAELYFLAKRLNEDLQFEQTIRKGNKSSKLD